ncbi:ORF6N domain-containing protein [Lonepinella sp. MS14436]|uniref:ORF6N domain-containing protein n=1 Tax=Lonepinella sp. MS14436 TaxID=3003619 RepID=UPI0036D7B52C
MESKNIILINQELINEKIYHIRGQKVMLDFELAELYGYETKRFNEQVKRNLEKFDAEDFMFQLADDEWKICLRSQNATSSWGGMRYLPYAFTEQGIYMLMTVLKGDLAVQQSKALIRTFKQMKDYIVENQGLIGQREFLQLSMQTTENTKEIRELKLSLRTVENKVAQVVDSLTDVVKKSDLSPFIFDFSQPQVKLEYLLLNGQPIEANIAYSDIYASANERIYIVDNYIGVKTLILLKNIRKGVEVTIFSDNVGKGLHNVEYQDFCREYPNISIQFKKTGNIVHDRYIMIDWNTDSAKVYHCGASSKDAGERITSISEVMDRQVYTGMIGKLFANPDLILK